MAKAGYADHTPLGDIQSFYIAHNVARQAIKQGHSRSAKNRGWIDTVGHRETPGRPALYATTKSFLDDLGLLSLQELPPLEEIARTLQLEPATSQPASNEPANEPAAPSASASR